MNEIKKLLNQLHQVVFEMEQDEADQEIIEQLDTAIFALQAILNKFGGDK